MGKFSSPLAEAAYLICGEGFAEEEYGTVQDIGWNALVEVSADILKNIDAPQELIDALAEVYEFDAAGALVWVREDTEGFVSIHDYGTDNGLRSGTDLVNDAWNEWMETYNAAH